MDAFLLKSTKTVLRDKDTHMIGSTSLFIASKLEDVKPIRLKVLFDKICHRKIDQHTLKRMETKILQTLEYDVFFVTPIECLG